MEPTTPSNIYICQFQIHQAVLVLMTYVLIFLSRNVDPAETHVKWCCCWWCCCSITMNSPEFGMWRRRELGLLILEKTVAESGGALFECMGARVKGGQRGETWEAFTITALWAASTWRLPRRWNLSSSAHLPFSSILSERHLEVLHGKGNLLEIGRIQVRARVLRENC